MSNPMYIPHFIGYHEVRLNMIATLRLVVCFRLFGFVFVFSSDLIANCFQVSLFLFELSHFGTFFLQQSVEI